MAAASLLASDEAHPTYFLASIDSLAVDSPQILRISVKESVYSEQVAATDGGGLPIDQYVRGSPRTAPAYISPATFGGYSK